MEGQFRQASLLLYAQSIVDCSWTIDLPAHRIVPSIYKELLGYLVRLGEEKDIWVTISGEVNCWWRQRAEINLVEDGERSRIEGPGKERARTACVNEEDGHLVLALEAEDNLDTRLTYYKPAIALK